MRLTRFLIFTLLLVSCGTNKIRLKSIEQNSSTTNSISEKRILIEHVQDKVNHDLTTEDINQIKEIELKSEYYSNDTPLEYDVKEFTEVVNPKFDEVDPSILFEASKATKIAKRSLILNSIGLISILIPTLGIFFILTGAISYFRASSFRYITEKGERDRKLSGKILLVDTVIVLIWLSLILFLIIL